MEKLKIKWVKNKLNSIWYTEETGALLFIGRVTFKKVNLYYYNIYKSLKDKNKYNIFVNGEYLSYAKTLAEAKNFCKNYMLQIQGLA
jgi:hypothetical protein